MVFRVLLSAGEGGIGVAKWTNWQTEGKKKHSKTFLFNTMFFMTPLRLETKVGVKNFILMIKDLYDWVRQFLDLPPPPNRLS